MRHLNYFYPFQSRPPEHEDQLTRAFLVLLRLVPIAQASFLDLIRAKQMDLDLAVSSMPTLSSLGERPDIQTQLSVVPLDEGRLVSVLLTNEPCKDTIAVRLSSEKRRHDGYLGYGDWMVIIENKPRDDVRPEQLSPTMDEATSIECYPVAINITWREVISALQRLERGSALDRIETELLSDFMEFVDDNFTGLQPYTTLRACKRDRGLLLKRCRVIMVEVGKQLGVSVEKGQRRDEYFLSFPEGAAKKVFLRPSSEEEPEGVLLLLYPGDTMGQAQRFFARVDMQAFLDLGSSGWDLAPNAHIAYQAKNLCWFHTDLEIGPYCDLWRSGGEPIRQILRGQDDFEADIRWLKYLGVLSDEDEPCIKRELVETRRNEANFCPGVGVEFRWPLAQAEALDDNGELAPLVEEKLLEALSTWAQDLPETDAP